MKVFISADIEGITTTTAWDETNPSHPSYALHAGQMTEEVLAAIAGAKEAGATEIVVKDAHGPGRNIDPTRMPSGVSLIRSWRGSPYSMAEGVDSTFDAAMFIGYHSPSGRMGNPMSHTISENHVYYKINGQSTSEFMLYSYAAALHGVPTVFLSGDKMLCEDFGGLHPKLITCPVKEGIGSMTKNYSTVDTLKSIQELSKKALSQDLKGALTELPERFEGEVYFKEHKQAERASHFPGVSKVSDNIVKFAYDDFYEILRTTNWIL